MRTSDCVVCPLSWLGNQANLQQHTQLCEHSKWRANVRIEMPAPRQFAGAGGSLSNERSIMAASYGQTASTLWGPKLIRRDTMSTDGVEISVHTLPKPLQREFRHVFDERNLPLESIRDESAEFLVVPTNQRAREDLVAVGDHIEREKDRLLNVFMDLARTVCQQVREAGFWADFIDPCSGLPMLTLNCNKVYSEVDGMECCLGTSS